MKTSRLTSSSSNLNNSHLKVAIVASWLTGVGGAEQLIQQLHKAFPDAPIYTSTYEPGTSTMFADATIKTSWMQRLPRPLRKHQLLTIPRQWYFSQLRLRDYDVVISAGSTEEKAVRAPDGTHINICYTPTLQYWVKPDNYLKKGSDGVNILWRFGLRILMPYVKWWDKRASKRPDRMYGISTAVNKRIQQYYQRQPDGLLYPPADVDVFANDGTQDRDGFIVFGRQVQHKMIDLAIAACNELGKKLVVIGNGPEHTRLVDMAGPTITFKTNVPTAELARYVGRAEAFIFPNEEDFGIVAVEAQAAGTPVIAYRAGGALDTVIEGVTGEFFTSQTIMSLSETLQSFNYKLYNRQAIIDQAALFSNERFYKNVHKIVVKK